MKRGRSTGTPTRTQAARMDAIAETGCVIAAHLGIKFGDVPMPCEVHHLTIGGKHGQKRRGHDYTVGLNPWSHRGEAFGPFSAAECREMFGPSYARQPRAFRELYPDEWLLEQQNALIGWIEEKAA